MSKFTRLRQICLVASDLEKAVGELCAVFDIEVCHRDPNVQRYGLVNALMPVGRSFIEVVSPIGAGPATAAGRYLQRRKGDGGYMVINDCDDVSRYRARAAALGIRLAEDRSYENKADLLQLNPRDTGGAILEFDRHQGGAALDGSYHWAGDHWQSYVRTERVRAIVGVELQSDDPQGLARRWAAIYGRSLEGTDNAPAFGTENARLVFVSAADGRGEGLAAVALSVVDKGRILEAAKRLGLVVKPDGTSVQICGVRFDLLPHGVQAASSSSG